MGRIIDISNYDFSTGDITAISIDTNVLLCMFYGNITYSIESHQKIYQSILENITENKDKVKLYTTTINICEALHVIEKAEYDIFKCFTGKNLGIKTYRNIVSERVKVKKEFETFIKQVEQCIDVVDEYVVSNCLVLQYINQVTNSKYDCLDYVLLDYTLQKGIDAIMTDDSDFCHKSYNGLLLTANPTLTSI